ncbi:MAG: threonine synthase [Pyrinomonadaceae bacterium]
MKYFSTNRKSPPVSFREAVLRGQPPDRGLFFPEKIPELSAEFRSRISEKPREGIAFEVIKPFVGGAIDDDSLFRICSETVNFDFPLVKITENIFALELFHGPTLAFKDVGARFMSRCLQHFSAEKSEKTIVIVATSGDTGGAVANGFSGVEGVEVIILFPRGKVSRVQELQLTTPGGNISALEVRGSFDQCQTLAKTALADEELNRRVFLTSANSINVARWLPQQFYYFFALQQWKKETAEAPVISVPSGNFGNICAGILARVAGLECRKFIAGTNANDIIPRFLQSGEMVEKPPLATLSNAMDVARPSNFVRILEIFDHDFLDLNENLEAVSVSDRQTADTMRRVFEKTGYILDPHGAVGFFALEKHLEDDPRQKGFFLETAHPVKFDSVEEITGTVGPVPPEIEDLSRLSARKTEIPADYEELKRFILGRI